VNKEYIVQLIWGGVAGAVIALAVVFVTGFAVRSDTAEQMARTAARDASTGVLVPICVAQAAADPDGELRVAELVAADRWKRAEHVRDWGWATMPGTTSPNTLIAADCAAAIVTAHS